MIRALHLQGPLAINYAAALAKASGASLHIMALAKPVEILLLLENRAEEKARASYLQDHIEWLKAQSKNLYARGIEVTTEVAWVDDFQQDILDYVKGQCSYRSAQHCFQEHSGIVGQY